MPTPRRTKTAQPAPATEPLMHCPYTGEAFTEARCDALGGAFYVAGGFDPSGLFNSQDEAIRLLRRRNGQPYTGPLRCPYTGEPLAVSEVPGTGKYRVVGRYFTPRAFFADKQAMLYAISFRDGVPPAFPEKHVIEVRDLEPVSDPTRGLRVSDDEADGRVAALVDA